MRDIVEGVGRKECSGFVGHKRRLSRGLEQRRGTGGGADVVRGTTTTGLDQE